MTKSLTACFDPPVTLPSCAPESWKAVTDTIMVPERPLPGTNAAFLRGCTCPRIDNCYGRGYRTASDGSTLFLYVEDCPLHFGGLALSAEAGAV